MKVSIKRTKIMKKEENRVKSGIIYVPHVRQTSTNIKFHDDGIFSKKIFGNIGKCECGELTEEGFCDNCGCRVVKIGNMPDFFIDLTIKVGAAFADYSSLRKIISEEDCRDICSYRKFLCEGEIRELTEENPASSFDGKDILIGEHALLKLGVPQSWIDENMTDFITISHPVYRPLIIGDNQVPFITGINNLYSNIIENINNVIEMHEITKGRALYLLAEYNAIYNIYNSIVNTLFDELQNTKYNIIKNEIISHPISGAIRGTLINRHDLHEDVILIGDTFIKVLYPFLYKKYNGNMAEINKELVEGNYICLLNRAPTIAHLSIVGMKPRIASLYPFGEIEKTNGGLLHNEAYVEKQGGIENFGYFNNITDNNNNTSVGDIERFGEGWEDGIDTKGLRCLAVNPIMMDGLAGDFDGDVLLLIALYSKSAIEQARQLLPSKSYTNYANGSIRNHIIEDFIYAEK